MASLISGFSYDIFISYRQKDNRYDGWVSEFVENLKRELEATFKEEVDVFHDINPLDGLLETHDVNASLRNKLKSLVFIPIISRTYCDPKSFAWSHEFKTFIEQASQDNLGLMIKVGKGNVASRVLPVRIHDIYPDDIKLFEETAGFVMRSIDFVYHEIGVNRQLRAKDDDVIKCPSQVLYRNQINKVALTVRDLIEGMKKISAPSGSGKTVTGPDEGNKVKKSIIENQGEEKIIKPVRLKDFIKVKNEKKQLFHLFKKQQKTIFGILGTLAVIAGLFFLLNRQSFLIRGGAKNYAMIVGINNYLDPQYNELDRPVKDAEMLYDVITSRYTFKKENIRLLRNATRAEMINGLEYFAKTVRPADNFLIFYSGHGYWDNGSQNGYWILADAKRNNKPDWFMNSTLSDYLGQIKSKHTLLISDACFDGLVFKACSTAQDASVAINKLNKLASRKAITSGIRIVFPENNVFASNLIEKLRENNNKYLSSEKLYTSFRETVKNISTKVPQYGVITSAGDEGGDFIFVLK